MAKKTEAEPGEQLMLMPIATEGAQKMLDKLRAYDKVKKQRLALLAKEIVLKNDLLPDIDAQKFKADDNGDIKFGIDNAVVEVITTEAKRTIKIKFKKES